jgi:hypothetical protein
MECNNSNCTEKALKDSKRCYECELLDIVFDEDDVE